MGLPGAPLPAPRRGGAPVLGRHPGGAWGEAQGLGEPDPRDALGLSRDGVQGLGGWSRTSRLSPRGVPALGGGGCPLRHGRCLGCRSETRSSREIRNVELLKLRFGEAPMHFCEVMLKVGTRGSCPPGPAPP